MLYKVIIVDYSFEHKFAEKIKIQTKNSVRR
jgi:hypothetical protein